MGQIVGFHRFNAIYGVEGRRNRVLRKKLGFVATGRSLLPSPILVRSSNAVAIRLLDLSVRLIGRLIALIRPDERGLRFVVKDIPDLEVF